MTDPSAPSPAPRPTTPSAAPTDAPEVPSDPAVAPSTAPDTPPIPSAPPSSAVPAAPGGRDGSLRPRDPLASTLRAAVAVLVLAALVWSTIEATRAGTLPRHLSYFTNQSNLAFALVLLVTVVSGSASVSLFGIGTVLHTVLRLLFDVDPVVHDVCVTG